MLARCHAVGSVTARQTGPGVVHLIGRIAGPLGGDETVLQVLVKAGARLEIRQVAATLVLPGRDRALSRSRLELDVEPGGELVLDLQPVVVCARAEHESMVTLRLATGAAASFTERVQLGRHDEVPGGVAGRLRADVADGLVLRQTLNSATVLADGHRGVLTALELGTRVGGLPRDAVRPGWIRGRAPAPAGRVADQCRRAVAGGRGAGRRSGS